jgi:hypothetical protein
MFGDRYMPPIASTRTESGGKFRRGSRECLIRVLAKGVQEGHESACKEVELD